MTLMEAVELSHSVVTGYGLYASLPISEGECILDFPGDILPADIARPGSMRLDEHFALEMPKCRPTAWYVNHSCSPNCYIELRGWPALIASQKINKGDQLTINYNAVWEDVEPFDCHCDAVVCLTRIAGFNYVSPADKIFLSDELSPYLKDVYQREKLS